MPIAATVVMRYVAVAAAVFAWMIAAQDTSPDALEAERLKTGLEAFQRRNYAEAASRLHAYVFDTDPRDADSWAQYALGVMHEQGLGTNQDTLLACAFFDLARRAYLRQPSVETSRLEATGNAAFERRCSDKTREEQSEISQLMSCFREWPPPAQFDLGDQRWVSVDRLRMTLHSGASSTVFPLPLNACTAVVLPTTHTRFGNRDFLEYYYWMAGGPGRGASSHALYWNVIEIRGDAIAIATIQELYRTTDLTYPSNDLKPELQDLARVQMNSAGEVEWIVATRPPRRGAIPSHR